MILTIFLMGLPLLVAVILHEVAHGWVAERMGDPTARALGRITLNPLKHIDPFLTILVPGALILSGSPIIFGGAKPVPVNPHYFRDARRGMLWVAAAGPATNIILASLSYLALLALDYITNLFGWPVGVLTLVPSWLLINSIIINVILAVFNLLPIPPLDGGRIVVGLLPLRWARHWARLEPLGIPIVIALIYFGATESLLWPLINGIYGHLARM